MSNRLLSTIDHHPADLPSPSVVIMPAANPLLDKILNDPKLPAAPVVALRIVELASNPDCDIDEVVSLLSADPAMCAQLMKTLNSSLYALSRPVTSVSRAVAVLGLHPLRSIVLGLALPSLQVRMKRDDGMRRYWKTSVSAAIVARELGLRNHDPFCEEGFIASLLCDLGMVILNQSIPKSYEPVWSGTEKVAAEALCAWEKRQVGVEHTTVSAGLLKKWRLPPEIVEPVRYHHSSYEAEKLPEPIRKRAELLDFSHQVAAIDEAANKKALPLVIDEAEAMFNMSKKEFMAFLTAVRPKIEAFAHVLHVDIGQCPNFAEVVSQGASELHRLSMETEAKPKSLSSAKTVIRDRTTT